MRGRWVVVVALVSLGTVAGCGHGTVQGDGSVTTLSEGPLPSGVIVARYAYGSGDVGGGNGEFLSLFDGQSGQHVRDLVHIDDGSALTLSGFSRASDASITYALSRGPRLRSDVSGGDPQPSSCGGQVSRIDATTGGTRTLFTVGDDWTVARPVSSPDGASVAYLSQPCTASFDQRVVVRDLATGRERRTWVPDASLTGVQWSSNGTRLVSTLLSPVRRTSADDPSYVVFPADHDGALPSSSIRRAPDAGCAISDAVFATEGIVLVEGCPYTGTAPARLVQLDGDGPAVRWRADTGLCPDGLTARHTPTGRLVLTSTAQCGGAAVPVDVVQMWSGQTSADLATYVNPQQFVSAAT